MKKLFVLLSLLIIVTCFTACEPDGAADSQSDASSIPAAEIVGRGEEFSLILAPVHYEDGETVESLYYKMAFLDGETCLFIVHNPEKSYSCNVRLISPCLKTGLLRYV